MLPVGNSAAVAHGNSVGSVVEHCNTTLEEVEQPEEEADKVPVQELGLVPELGWLRFEACARPQTDFVRRPHKEEKKEAHSDNRLINQLVQKHRLKERITQLRMSIQKSSCGVRRRNCIRLAFAFSFFHRF